LVESGSPSIKEYDKLVWVRHLFEILLSGYVRRVGNLAQIKLLNGIIVLLPFGVGIGIVIREIFIDEVYDRFISHVIMT